MNKTINWWLFKSRNKSRCKLHKKLLVRLLLKQNKHKQLIRANNKQMFRAN